MITDRVCFLYVLWTGVHGETQIGFTVSCLIKHSTDWPNRFDEQPCQCCLLSTNMTSLVGLTLQRTDRTVRYIVWLSDIQRKDRLHLCNSTICSGRYYSNNEPLNDELNPVCHLQALLGAHHILHVFRIRVKLRLFSKSQKHIMDNQLDATITGY